MKIKTYFLLLMLFLISLISNSNLFSQSLSGTVTVTPSACPSTGQIQVNATGGTSPYTYTLSGTVSIASQTQNIFNNLPVGTYSITITDKASSSFLIDNIVVGSSYVYMNPTAGATKETCQGSNNGYITITMPYNQAGQPPYIYKIVSGPTLQDSVVSSLRTNVFSNLLPGNYRVSVTDFCGEVQSRDVVLGEGPVTTNVIYVGLAYSSPNCDSTDYYIVPSIGTYYPHTYYAYPDGNMSSTPYSMTVTGSDLVTIPGANTGGRKGFKFTLPTPSVFYNGTYTFKHTNICHTDVNDPAIFPYNVKLGTYTVNYSLFNCGHRISVVVNNGWTFPVKVKLIRGNDTLTQTLNDPNIRTAYFDNLITGATYNVQVTDICPSHNNNGNPISSKVVIPAAPNLSITKYIECNGNIDGVSALTLGFGNGWQKPINASIISGPSSYYSNLLKQTINARYPVNTVQGNDTYVRFRNLAPGKYIFRVTDSCGTSKIDSVTITSEGRLFNFPDLITYGCPGSQVLKSIASSNCGGINTDIYVAPNILYGNGIGNNFTLYNMIPRDYIVYYYSIKENAEVFVNPQTYINNSAYVLLKSIPFTIEPISSYPTIGSYGLSRCSSDSSFKVQLYKSNNSANIKTFSIEYNAGQGNFITPQNSSIFTLADFGSHAYRLEDSCGNIGTGFIYITPNAPPIFSSNKCINSNIQTLTVIKSPNTTYIWIKPDGTQVIADTLVVDQSAYALNTYKLIAIHSIADCIETDTNTFKLPIPSIQYPDTTISCENIPYRFEEQISVPVESYSWTKDNIVIPGDTNFIYITSNGTYKLTVKFAGDSCTSTYSRNFTIYDSIAPILLCPADTFRYISDTSTNYMTNLDEFDANISDNCDTTITIEYSISGATTANNISNTTINNTILNIGTNNIMWTATDNYANTNSCSFIVDIYKFTFSVISSNISCFGANDGTINITATGGKTPYEYSIDAGATWQSSNIFNNLSPNTYTIYVKDANGHILKEKK